MRCALGVQVAAAGLGVVGWIALRCGDSPIVYGLFEDEHAPPIMTSDDDQPSAADQELLAPYVNLKQVFGVTYSPGSYWLRVGALAMSLCNPSAQPLRFSVSAESREGHTHPGSLVVDGHLRPGPIVIPAHQLGSVSIPIASDPGSKGLSERQIFDKWMPLSIHLTVDGSPFRIEMTQEVLERQWWEVRDRLDRPHPALPPSDNLGFSEEVRGGLPHLVKRFKGRELFALPSQPQSTPWFDWSSRQWDLLELAREVMYEEEDKSLLTSVPDWIAEISTLFAPPKTSAERNAIVLAARLAWLRKGGGMETAFVRIPPGLA